MENLLVALLLGLIAVAVIGARSTGGRRDRLNGIAVGLWSLLMLSAVVLFGTGSGGYPSYAPQAFFLVALIVVIIAVLIGTIAVGFGRAWGAILLAASMALSWALAVPEAFIANPDRPAAGFVVISLELLLPALVGAAVARSMIRRERSEVHQQAGRAASGT